MTLVAAPRPRSSQSVTPGSVALLALLGLLACEDRRSVGTVPCGDEERVLCDTHVREVLQPNIVKVGPDSEADARILWEHPIPPCQGVPCDERSNEYLVHADGEVTLAAVRRSDRRQDLWVAWLDAAGGVVFETGIPGSTGWLGNAHVTSLALEPDAQGGALLLVGRGEGTSTMRGTLRAYALARSGEITQSFEVDTGKTWPGAVGLLDSDVVIARSRFSTSVELARYPRRGELHWRQTQIARLAEPSEVGIGFDPDTQSQLFELAIDRRGRIWGSLHEGLFGLVQLDPNGIVGWHGLIALLPAEPALAVPLAIDSRDRPILGVGQTVLRIEPDGSDDELRTPLGSSGFQEQFYPQIVHGLDVDDEDQVYVATQDGSFSNHRLLIERISEDFRQRDRFVLPLTGVQAMSRVLSGLQLSAERDAYVRISVDPNVVGIDGVSAESAATRIARVRLDEPAP